MCFSISNTVFTRLNKWPVYRQFCFVYLLSTVRGEIEHEHGEEGDAHAGDDQVDRVEQRLPPHRDVEGDVQVRLVTTRVDFNIPLIFEEESTLFH